LSYRNASGGIIRALMPRLTNATQISVIINASQISIHGESQRLNAKLTIAMKMTMHAVTIIATILARRNTWRLYVSL
jgi:hypothetical protein